MTSFRSKTRRAEDRQAGDPTDERAKRNADEVKVQGSAGSHEGFKTQSDEELTDETEIRQIAYSVGEPLSLVQLRREGVSVQICVEQLIITGSERDVIVAKHVRNDLRRIEQSFNHAQFGDNVNVQGDDVQQTQTASTAFFERAYSELLQDIEELTDGRVREQALHFAEALKRAVASGQESEGKKFFAWLRPLLRDTSSVVSIGKAFGWL
ncbi:hypothetical protein [Numidum massiliense]|uniref:hypothetical protein n=1 Tax=Numidum massiliense TaxID=1522315 RepID=UPI0006D5B626|nr:hypothetical protein [Numidum massiliense]